MSRRPAHVPIFSGPKRPSEGAGFVRSETIREAVALVGHPEVNVQPCAAAAGFDLYRIGDAVSSRSIAAAMLDAYRLCCRM